MAGIVGEVDVLSVWLLFGLKIPKSDVEYECEGIRGTVGCQLPVLSIMEDLNSNGIDYKWNEVFVVITTDSNCNTFCRKIIVKQFHSNVSSREAQVVNRFLTWVMSTEPLFSSITLFNRH